LEMGFYLSFSGILTFQNAAMLREIAKHTPLDRVLIETDCPYLTPVPHRGKRNEPAYVSHVAKQLAAIHADRPDLPVEQIERITTENAKRLFKIA
ncbi:MAG TPA: TatD family hydrolase, partial [Nitrospira sp.]|nr:TatD family hydrolase [Nitrospira sp.]